MIFWLIFGGFIVALWCVIGVLIFVYRNRVPEVEEVEPGEIGREDGPGGGKLCSWTG